MNILNNIQNRLLIMIGSPNEFQIKTLLFNCFALVLAAGANLSLSFLLQDPLYICKSNGISFSCSQAMACQPGIESEIDYINSPKSLVVEFGLICESAYKKNWIGSVAYFSSGFGYLYYGFYFDGKNKLKFILTMTKVLGLILIVIYFINSIFFITILLGCYNFLYNSLCILPYIFMFEIAQNNPVFRGWTVALLDSAWGVSQMLSGFLSYLYYDWRIFFAIYGGIPLLLCYYCFRDIFNLQQKHTITQNFGNYSDTFIKRNST